MKLIINVAGGIAIVVITSITAFLHKVQFPKDAEDSLEKVRNHTIRVGFTNAAPWVYPSATRAQGIEAAIVSDFAKTLHAKTDWVEGTEEQLYTALKKNEIDILIAGITAKTPWKEEVGVTKPYLETEIVNGAPPSSAVNNSSSLEGQWVAVKKGTVQGYYVRKRKARVFYTERLPAHNRLCVGYNWQLDNWRLQNTGLTPAVDKRILIIVQKVCEVKSRSRQIPLQSSRGISSVKKRGRLLGHPHN